MTYIYDIVEVVAGFVVIASAFSLVILTILYFINE